MRKLALVVLTGFLIPGLAHALGLGEIRVDSALNQPLKAEITVLSANPDEVIDIVTKLADQEAFDRLGLERPYELTKLQFKPAVRDGVPVIVVTTRKPVKEPFLDFLLDVRWPNGRLLREYTVLLDPPVLMESRAVATEAPEVAAEPQVETVVAPAPVVSVEPEPAPEPVVEAAPEPAPEPVAVSEPEPAPEPVAVSEPETVPAAEPVAVSPAAEPVIRPDTGVSEEMEVAEMPLFPLIPIGIDDQAAFYDEGPSGDYTVKANDTLWEIANANRPDDVSVNQMMMAMLRANPDAFYNDNINNLKKGVILRMPSREELEAVDTATANMEVKEQYALWREYREQVAGETTQQYVVPAIAEDEPGVETASAEEEAVETEVVAEEGELKILAPESETATGETKLAGGEDLSTLQNDLNLAKESLESARQKNNDLESRVKELEEMLKKQERLINLKDEQISDLQSQTQEAPAEAIEEPATEEAPAAVEEPQTEAVEEPAATEVVEETVTEEVVEEVVAVEEAATGEEVVEEVVEAETTVTEEVAVVEEQPVEEEVQIAAIEEAAQEPAAEPEPAVTRKPEPVQAAPSFLDDLLADPKMLGIAGGGILLVIALILSLVRRMGKNKEAAPVQPEPETGAMAAEAEEVVPDIEETQVMEQPVFEEEPPVESEPVAEEEPFSGESTQVMGLSEEEAVAEESVAEADDTLSEADVYLAYGLHDQCEELLKKAIEERPDRNDYRAKLLENYFAAKEKDKFQSMAQELHDKLGNTSDKLWIRTVVMGKELAPENPLFAGDVSDVSLEDIAAEKPETAEFDLTGDLGAGDEAPDLEIGSVDLDMDEGLDLAQAQPTEELETVEVEAPADEGLEFDVGDIDLGDVDLGGDEELLTIDEASETETLDLTEEAEEGPGTLTIEQPPTIPEDDLSADLTLETDIPVSFEMDEVEVDVDENSDTGTLEVGELEVTDEDLNLDTEALDLDVDFGATEESSESGAADIDIGLDEDLGLDEEIGLPDSEDEVGTKLDLAKAYIDMGDNDGARSTLEEVLNEGNDDQKKEAQDLMSQIS